MYLSGSNAGLGREDDAGLVRVYLPKNKPHLIKELSDIPTLAPLDQTRLVQDMLNAVHLAAAAEALALAASIGLNVKATYNVIKKAAGSSRIFVSLGEAFSQGAEEAPHTLRTVFEKLVRPAVNQMAQRH
jgi:3-hydroxyisobutyrate dehydrogenase